MKEFLFGKTDWKSIRIIVVIAFVVIVILGLIPIRSHSSHHTPIWRSTVQVRSMVQGAILFATDQDDKMPSADQWPQELIVLGIIEPELLVSPLLPDMKDPYTYVPSGYQVFEGDFVNRIVIYENPDHYQEGVVVGFADGRAEVIPHDQFEQMLADQIAEEASRP